MYMNHQDYACSTPENIAQTRQRTIELKLQSNDAVVVDTNVWMHPGQHIDLFLDHLIQASQSTGRRICIPEDTLIEIEKHRRGLAESSTPISAARAEVAISRLKKLRGENLMDDSLSYITRQLNDEGFADAGFIQIHFKSLNRRLLLVTQEFRIYQTMRQQIPELACAKGAMVEVLRVDGFGYLGRFKEGEYDSVPSDSDQQPMLSREPQYVWSGQPATLIPDPKFPLYAPMTGSVLRASSGCIELGDKIAHGSEADVYELVGDNSKVAKIYRKSNPEAREKVALLIRQCPDIPGVVFPEDSLTENGAFVGYIMPRIENACSLNMFFSGYGQQELLYSADGKQACWDRMDFVRVASEIVRMASALHKEGILISDVSSLNILIGKTDGKPDSGKVYMIDIDSAQFGPDEGCIYAPGGVSHDFCSPRILNQGWKAGDLITQEDDVFSVFCLAACAMMVGVHPFLAEAVPDATLHDLIAARAFPYGPERRAKPLPGANRIYSQFPASMKKLLEQVFMSGTEVTLDNLSSEIEYYLSWMANPENLAKWPEIRSLRPTLYKPFMTRCAAHGCNHEMDGANSGINRNGQFICSDCARKIVEVRQCSDCGKPFGITYGEIFLGKRLHDLCRDCLSSTMRGDCSE